MRTNLGQAENRKRTYKGQEVRFYHSGSGCTMTDPCQAGAVETISECYAGFIQSPGYPNNYPMSADWSWNITNPGAASLKLLLIEFNVRTTR